MGKDKEVPIEWNRVKFVSVVIKHRFYKAVEINKNIIIERGLEFQLR